MRPQRTLASAFFETKHSMTTRMSILRETDRMLQWTSLLTLLAPIAPRARDRNESSGFGGRGN
jgi:hypothetical protein